MWFYAFWSAVNAVNAGCQVAIGNDYTAMFCFFCLGICLALWFADWADARFFRQLDAALDAVQKRLDEVAAEDVP